MRVYPYKYIFHVWNDYIYIYIWLYWRCIYLPVKLFVRELPICSQHQIICSLFKLNCSVTLTHLFAIFIFSLVIVYNQIFTVFNIFFILYYYLFIMFNYFVRNNNYLFSGSRINYLVFKRYFLKISCKYSQVRSYFEDLVVRNTMV